MMKAKVGTSNGTWEEDEHDSHEIPVFYLMNQRHLLEMIIGEMMKAKAGMIMELLMKKKSGIVGILFFTYPQKTSKNSRIYRI